MGLLLSFVITFGILLGLGYLFSRSHSATSKGDQSPGRLCGCCNCQDTKKDLCSSDFYPHSELSKK